jgi:TRAP-type C4-dicarboxylate transport system permease small subunit
MTVQDTQRDAGESAAPAAAWVPTFPRVRRLDASLYRAERWLCGGMFLAMGLVMAAAVLANTFVNRREWSDVAILFALCLLGTRTRVVKAGETRMSAARSIAISAALTSAISALVWVYTEQFPGGFVWAQKVALVMMLWVALLGASIATYERGHLALELGEKLWPKRWLHLVKAAAHAVTSAFCLGLVVWSVSILVDHADKGTTVEPLVWFPRWTALAVIPYAFLVMTVRFLAQSYTVATGQAEPIEEQLPT